jgi:hypothetical protein
MTPCFAELTDFAVTVRSPEMSVTYIDLKLNSVA